MNIIAIDASGIAGSVAYIADGKLVGEYYVCHKLTHSQTIMPMLEDLKAMIGIELEKVDAIAVTSGPGSFTGLRIGVATAKAMAMALEVPIIGIPTLDVMANNMTFTEAIICPIMDARRNQVYTAYYKWQEASLERISDYLGIQIDELLETLKDENRPVIFLGDGVAVFKEKIQEVLGEGAKFAPSHQLMQRASTLAHLAHQAYERGEVSDPDTFVPMYLRKSQAERELEERENGGH
ncbi:MAG: tRNA (adenosine(37)-N6)-threonylcarbamoyltransferase complex dimerization subunit type 1 TsaB [Cellulosilyticaceae bacterium]